MGTTSLGTTADAVLRAGDVEIPGLLVRDDDWAFAPTTPLDPRELRMLHQSDELVVVWGGLDQRREITVAVERIRSGELAIRPLGDERRIQRRRAVRAPIALPCEVFVAEPGRVVTLEAETIDMSATGASILLHTTSGTEATVPSTGSSVGLIVQLDGAARVAVARILGVRSTDAGRTVLRMRFDQIRSRDSDAIHRRILQTERERLR